jgi:hypothetical protein
MALRMAATACWKRAEATFNEQGVVSPHVLDLERLAASRDLLRHCVQNPMLATAGVYRRSLVCDAGGYSETLWQAEDYEFHVRLALRYPRFELLLDALNLQRLRANSRSQNGAEVCGSALQAVELIAQQVPKTYHQNLADVAANTGIQLLRLGAKPKAREAFRFAKCLGTPTFDKFWGFYRGVALTLGPQAAEWMSACYRRLLPSSLRQWSRDVAARFGLGAKREGYF